MSRTAPAPAGELARLHFATPAMQGRLARALATVTAALAGSRRPYVAFSGGKDSLAVLALVHAVRPDVPLLWSDDELEYPELPPFMADIRRLADGLMIVGLGWARHAGWFDPWRDPPYWREPLPGTLTVGMDADDWMAMRGHDLTILGTRMGESRRRRDWLARAGPTYRVKRGTGTRCCPLWDWTDDDVWALIAGWGLPYCPTYDRMAALGWPVRRWRVGPLPLARRAELAEGWPDLLARLEMRYGPRWE